MFYFMQTDCKGLQGVYFTRHTLHNLVFIFLIAIKVKPILGCVTHTVI